MDLYNRYPELTNCRDDIEAASELLIDTYSHGGKVLICGNGGSCADSEHIVGELMKGFLKKRPLPDSFRTKLTEMKLDNVDYICDNLQVGLPAISLPSQSAIISAFANDVAPDMVYAQMVLGYGKSGDVLVCISTSGNSSNCLNAAKVAKALGVRTLAMTGAMDSCLSEICDVCIKAPDTETYKVQEYHLPIYHYLCAMCEEEFF